MQAAACGGPWAVAAKRTVPIAAHENANLLYDVQTMAARRTDAVDCALAVSMLVYGVLVR